jgi:hypothetical protein
MAHQYPHQYIYRDIAGNVNTNTKTSTDLYLAKVVMKFQDQSAQATRINNNNLIVNYLTGIAGAVKITAQVFDKPVYG